MATFTVWQGHNCLRSCIATLANVDVQRVPDLKPPFTEGNRIDYDAYSDELARRLGFRLQTRNGPPGPDRFWIPIMRTSSGTPHAIVCRGKTLLADPAEIFRAYQPSMLDYGLELVAA